MKDLYIEGTRTSPEIRFDEEKNILSIKGESFPENVADFYNPILSWIENHLESIEDKEFIVNMEIIYFNTSSSKVFLDMFDILDEAAEEGKQTYLNWIFHEENESAMEAGEEFQEDLEFLKFNLVQKDS